jgi:hypothetical protein
LGCASYYFGNRSTMRASERGKELRARAARCPAGWPGTISNQQHPYLIRRSACRQAFLRPHIINFELLKISPCGVLLYRALKLDLYLWLLKKKKERRQPRPARGHLETHPGNVLSTHRPLLDGRGGKFLETTDVLVSMLFGRLGASVCAQPKRSNSHGRG